jgi:crossover junction endodeoxyribonuclease RusA
MSSGDLVTEGSILYGRMTLPWPPSVNTYWRMFKGRMLISRDGREYRTRVAEEVVDQKVHKFGKRLLVIEIEAQRPDKRRRDLDNLLKAVLDSLAHAGVFEDDSQVVDLRIFWSDQFGGRLSVSIAGFGSE